MICSKHLLYKMHLLSLANRPLVKNTGVYGCFCCGAINSPEEIDPEMDGCNGFPLDTVQCHYCGIGAAVPDSRGRI